MKKYKVIKTIVALLLIILLNNFSYLVYANTLTVDSLKKSLENILTSEVKIETKSENANSTITLGVEEGEKIVVEDSEIKYYYKQENVFDIEYFIEDGKCTFHTILDYNNKNIDNEDDAMSKIALIMAQYYTIQKSYISVSNALGIDNSLAYTYFSQNYTDSEQISNQIYTLTQIETEDSMEITLEINIEELAKLDSSMIDSTSFSTVTITKTSNEEKEEENINNTVDNTTGEAEEEKENNVVTDNTVDNTVDNTISTNKIPAAGRKMTLAIFVLIIVIVTGVGYLKVREYNDVK